MSTVKPAMTITALAFALIFGGGVYVFMNFGNLAKGQVEKAATRALGVSVKIGALDVSLKDKAVVAKNITVNNPPGFTAPHAATVKAVYIALDTASEKHVVFSDIRVEGTEVALEVKKQTTNLMTLKKGMPSNVSDTDKDKSGEATKVTIDQLHIEGAKIMPTVTLLAEQDLSPIVLPDVKMAGIGSKQKGVLPEDAISQIWKNVIRHINVSAYNAGYFEGLSRDALNEISRDQVDALKNDITEGINNQIDKIGKTIKGLFE